MLPKNKSKTPESEASSRFSPKSHYIDKLSLLVALYEAKNKSSSPKSEAT